MACAGDLVLLIDPQGPTLVDCNAQVGRRLGWSAQRLRDQGLGALCDAEALDCLITAAVAANGAVITRESRWRTCDGELLDMALHAVRLLREGAAMLLVVAREPEPSALADGHERFRLALLGANDGLFDWDLTSDLIYYSPRWKSMLGYAEHELANRLDTWRRLVEPKEGEAAWAMLRAYIEGRRPDYETEFRMRHKDGHWVHILARGQVQRAADGTPVRLVGTHVDISQRKHDEAALRASEARFRSLVESLQDGYLFFSQRPDGVLDYVSPAVEGILGLGPEDLARGFDPLLTDNPINEAGRAATAALLAGERRPAYDLEMRHRDGHLRRLRVGAYPIFDGDQALIAVQGIAQDITDAWRNARMLDVRNQVFERLATGCPLREVLDTLTRHVEALEPAMLCSVLRFDAHSRRLFALSAPSLPPFYVEAVDGIEVHAELGSCGAAACRGERVVVADLLKHRYWAPFRALMARTPMRACWSEPIRGGDGQVLGTFAMYFTAVRAPDPTELTIIESAAALAAVVIEHRQAEAALRDAEARSRLLLESTTEGIFGLEPDGRISFINPAAARMLGYAPAEIVGQVLHGLAHHSNSHGEPLAPERCRMFDAAANGTEHHVSDEVLWRRDGSAFPVEYKATAIRRDGRVVGAVVTFHDITERRHSEREIQHLAFHDVLTGLPNRLLFSEELVQTLARFQSRGDRFALHLMDLDHFKDVNDSLGHPVGDRLLRAFAERIGGLIRGADIFARLGGDEFGLIQTDIGGPEDASFLADRVLHAMTSDFDLDGFAVASNTSIGIVLSTQGGCTADDLMSRADVALYKAKEAGRGGYAFYEDAMTAELHREMELTRHLAQAVRRGELYLDYQPQLDLASGRICGVEALLRWRHPEHGLMPPAEFVPLAEKRGSILEISDWVVGEAFRQAADWHARGLDFGRMAVNLSAVQVRDPKFHQAIEARLAETGAPPERIELELTETVLIEASARTQAAIERLSGQGIDFALDDFGTGFSSLSYLRRFRVDKLKIDREFINDVAHNPHDAEIVKATIALGRALGLSTTAEGVETEAQLAFLRRHGCDQAQGYLIGRPMSVARVEAMIGAAAVDVGGAG